MLKLIVSMIFFLLYYATFGQEFTLSFYKKIKASEREIKSISFSDDSKVYAIADDNGEVTQRALLTDAIIGQKINTAGIAVEHDFIGSKRFMLVDGNGKLGEYDSMFAEIKSVRLANEIKLAAIDHRQQRIAFLTNDNTVSIINLRTLNPTGKIAKVDGLFIGFDRLSEHIASVTQLGEASIWKISTQRAVKKYKLAGGRYGNTRSFIQTASFNRDGDEFFLGVQELAITQGSVAGRSHPERRNMIVGYNYITGEETRRINIQNKVDGMAIGPGSMHVTYFSSDSRHISMLNIASSELTSTISVDERPSCITLSDDQRYLAVGTVAGNVYIYEVSNEIKK